MKVVVRDGTQFDGLQVEAQRTAEGLLLCRINDSDYLLFDMEWEWAPRSLGSLSIARHCRQCGELMQHAYDKDALICTSGHIMPYEAILADAMFAR